MDFRAPTLGSAVHVGMACGLLEKDYVAGIDQWKEEYLQKHILEIADGVDELIAETTGCLNQEIEDMTNEVTSTAKEITGRALKVFGPDQWEPVLFNKAPMVEIVKWHRLRRVASEHWIWWQGEAQLVARGDHKVRTNCNPWKPRKLISKWYHISIWPYDMESRLLVPLLTKYWQRCHLSPNLIKMVP